MSVQIRVSAMNVEFGEDNSRTVRTLYSYHRGGQCRDELSTKLGLETSQERY